MKYIKFERYGDAQNLKLCEKKRPEIAENDVIKTAYSTATRAENLIREGKSLNIRLMFGFFKPKLKYQIPGIEFSGTIVEKGRQVSNFRIGDQVIGYSGLTFGALSEFIKADAQDPIIVVPKHLTLGEGAACVDNGTTALKFLRDVAGIRPGSKVLIIGASGSLGAWSVQLSKYFGARVTGICSSKNKDLVLKLGADEVIAYDIPYSNPGDEKYDIIFDTLSISSFRANKKKLTRKGVYLSTVFSINTLFLQLATRFTRKKAKFYMVLKKTKLLKELSEIIEKEEIKPLIDRVYELEDISEAYSYVSSGRKKGNVLISF